MPLVREMQICCISDSLVCFVFVKVFFYLMLCYILSSLPWKTSPLMKCVERLTNSKIQSDIVIMHILGALGKEKTEQMLFDVIKTNCNLKRS